jgi:hypothetical protein
MPKGAWDIGDEVEFAESSAPAWTRWGMAAAAAVMLLVTPAGYNMWADAQPHAIVTVDINPSLELTLNRKDAVLKARALNEDGALVLEGVTWSRKPVDDVLTAVTTRAVEVQKLDPTSDASAVLMAVAPVKAELPKEQADRIRDKSFAAVTQVAGEANVAVLEATAEEKKEAEAAGVDVGQHLYYKDLVEQGHQVKLEDVKVKGPGKLTQELGINTGEFFSQAQKEHGGEPVSKGKGQEKKGSESGNGTGGTVLPSLPVLGQPVVPAQGDDKGGQQKGDKPSDDRKSDDKKSDDKPGNNGNNGKSDDKKANDPKSDDKPGNNGNKGNNGNGNSGGQGASEPPRVAPGQAKPKQDEKDDKKEEKQDDKKKSSWTVPFLGIEIEKPGFLQDKESKEDPSKDAATEPRANPPGGGASDDDGQKVEGKPGKGSDQKGKEKPEEKSNKQEDNPGTGQGKAPKDSKDQKDPNQKGNSGKR